MGINVSISTLSCWININNRSNGINIIYYLIPETRCHPLGYKLKTSQFISIHEGQRCILSSWWCQPVWTIFYSQTGSFPQVGVKIKKCLKPPPRIFVPFPSGVHHRLQTMQVRVLEYCVCSPQIPNPPRMKALMKPDEKTTVWWFTILQRSDMYLGIRKAYLRIRSCSRVTGKGISRGDDPIFWGWQFCRYIEYIGNCPRNCNSPKRKVSRRSLFNQKVWSFTSVTRVQDPKIFQFGCLTCFGVSIHHPLGFNVPFMKWNEEKWKEICQENEGEPPVSPRFRERFL